MRTGIKFLIGLMICTSMYQLNAQDIHFSQYYASPMTLNPALTGKFNGDYRISGIYRSQWNSIAKPLFTTPSGSADFSLFKEKLKNDAFGVGVMFLNDQQNDGLFNQIQAMLSLAYHKGLGDKSQLSAGFQGGYVQISGNNNYIFADEYFNNTTNLLNPIDPLTNLPIKDPSLESVNTENQSYIDFNAGLLFNTKLSDKTVLYVGGSVLHLTTPTLKYILNSTQDNQLPINYIAHGGLEIELSDKILLIPGALFQMQAKTYEFNFGATVGFKFLKDEDKDAYLFAGAWHRLAESIIPKIGFEYEKIRVGFAFDVNVSSLKDVKNSTTFIDPEPNVIVTARDGKLPTAFEISLSYIGGFFRPTDNIILFNPRY